MKILHLDTGYGLRGGQRQLLMLAHGLEKRGHEQWIAAQEGSELETLARKDGFNTAPLTLHGAGSARSLFQLRRMVREHRIEILHAHDARAQTFSWLASRGTPTHRIASRRVIFAPRNRLIHRWKYSHTCHRVIAVSSFARDALIKSGIPSTNVELIYDGIDIPPILPVPAEKVQARRGFQLQEDEFVVGHAGAFTREKGQETAIQAFKLATPRIERARLLLAGDGPLRRVLADRYRLLDPASQIRLLGNLDSLSSFMKCLDVFLMPSLSEGLGSSALLAMAYGVPVIASRVGGLPEIVLEGETGWLVDPGDPAAMAEKIVNAACQERRAALSSGARRRAELFTNDIMTLKVERLYRRLAGKEPERPAAHEADKTIRS